MPLVACNQSVHDLSATSAPVVTIHGHVDPTSLHRTRPDAPLIGALIWAGLPQVNPVCLAFDSPAIKSACPDPYGVFIGQIERAAPVDADGNFELPLDHLPKASVSVGDEVTRIAYGSLLVAEDSNGDGQLTLAAVSSVGRRGRDDPAAPTPAPDDPAPDVILGATFYTLHADQQRLVFREGGFVKDSCFYPAPGCGEPPPGFSIMVAPPYDDSTVQVAGTCKFEPPVPAAGACTFEPPDTTVEVPPVSAGQALALMCRQVQRTGRGGPGQGAGQGAGIRQPDQEEQPASDLKPICLSHEVFAIVPPGSCPQLAVWALKGCDSNLFCDPPDWDATASPPSWWPSCP